MEIRVYVMYDLSRVSVDVSGVCFTVLRNDKSERRERILQLNICPRRGGRRGREREMTGDNNIKQSCYDLASRDRTPPPSVHCIQVV